MRNTGARSDVIAQHADGTNKVREKTYIAGPKEHWYFSADIPLTYAKQLTYDATTSQAVEKEVPPSFYVSLNYKIGDVFMYPGEFAKADDINFFDDFAFKGMVKVNSPADSFGIGLSYHFKIAEVFVARVLTKNDSSATDAGGNGAYSTIFGLSFDITKGFEWLTKAYE